QSTPTWTTSNLTGDPLFVNRGTNDYHLLSNSPAKGAGVTISSSNTYNNYPPWQGKAAIDNDGLSRSLTLPSLGALDTGIPTYIYSTAAAVATPSVTSWGGGAPCGGGICYRLPLDPNVVPAGITT